MQDVCHRIKELKTKYDTVDGLGVKYDYKLVYNSLKSDTKNVCLIADLENGDSSCWAGVPYGILFGGNVRRPDVYAVLHGNDKPDPDLPDVLADASGAWVRIDPDSFDSWNKIYSLAFDFGDTVFGPELGESGSAEIVVRMRSNYGSKEGSREVDIPESGLYELRNTCRVYESVGEKGDTVSYDSECVTSVYVGYGERGYEIPKTGGIGAAPYAAIGFMIALPAAMLLWLDYRRKRR